MLRTAVALTFALLLCGHNVKADSSRTDRQKRAVEHKYGKGKVPCQTYDSLRERYFRDLVKPWCIKNGYNIESTRQEFLKQTEQPRTRTWTGRRRKGCIEKEK